MSTHPTLDPESFQKLLASAFVVQESGMDTQSRVALVELQRSIATGELDLDRALHRIADRARNLANATGIAIAQLKGDHLVYRAGSGSAATYVRRHVMAILSVSTHNEARGEILRVEDAQTDARIEAAICREFGAKSLLILPIYQDRAVTGVFEVLFSEAHVFQDREVHTYRLMAGLVGEAMCLAAQLEQKKTPTAERSTMRKITSQIQKFLNDGGSVSVAASNRAVYEPCRASIAEAGGLLARRQPASAASMITQRVKRVPLYKRRWKTAVAAVLVIASWIGYRDHRSASPLGASGLQGSNTIEQQVPFVPAKRRSANELYVAQDVTVRYFTPKPGPWRARVGEGHVEYIGEDVTVRYFTPRQRVATSRPVGGAAQPVDR